MAPYDFIAEKNIWDERLTFGRKLLNERGDIVCFVDNRVGWDGARKYDGFFKGSFNPKSSTSAEDATLIT